MGGVDIATGIVTWMILAASIALHEWGHAYSADKLSDQLPRAQGRVTLNPLAHLCPIGTGVIPLLAIFGILPFLIIGWGKPVQVSLPNPKTRARDDMVITACGPLMNAVIALVASIAAGLLFRFGNTDLVRLCNLIIQINATLIVFNLLPIPPLDGSHFLKYAVRMSDESYMRFSSWGILILLVLINIRPFTDVMISLIRLVLKPFNGIIGIVGGLGVS